MTSLLLQLFRDRYLLMLSSLLLMVASIHVFTYAHPFLLADNRHYTFYLWRRVISRLRYASLVHMHVAYAFSRSI